MTDPLPLDGVNVVVTGSGRGIGAAAVERMAAEGANVIVNGTGANRSETVDAVVERINAGAGGRAIACCGDVADDAFAAELIATCIDGFGSIDALVNIAGMGAGPGQTFIDEPSPDRWRRLLDVHLTGTFNCCRHAVPHLRERGGSIVNTTSHAFLGIYSGTGYAAAKGGVVSLTWGMAADLRATGVRVNAIAPGARTDMSTGDQYEKQIWALYERGALTEAMRDASLRVAGPEFVAPMYAWLVGPGSVGITGRVFSVTGNSVGLFPKPRETTLAERPNADGPWSLDDLDGLLGADR